MALAEASKTHTLDRVVRLASGVTMVLLALTLVSGIQNPVAAAPQVVFLGFVVAGLWRKRPWAGYGPALVVLASLAATLVTVAQGSASIGRTMGVSILFGLLGLMYFLAGRAMGPAWPVRPGWVALAGVVFLFPVCFQAYAVPTSGMEPTVMQGDWLLIPRIRMGQSVARGQIVAFRYPVDRRQTFLKRVVAVGGDRVEIRDTRLFVNGVEVSEAYAKYRSNNPYVARDEFPSVQTPAGKVFVLGDNRDSSTDSRQWGFVDESDVIGTPWIVYWSEDRRQVRGSQEGRLSKIRWDRLFRPVR